MEVFLSAILIISIYLFSSNHRLMFNITLLGALTISIIWFNFFLHSLALTVLTLSLEITYFSITTIAILKHVLSFKKATIEKIYGAICGYLLIGIIWALIYTLIEVVNPSSFHISEKLESTFFDAELSYPLYFLYFIYYSFVTISTLGYGDITPLSHAARVFSSLESIIGQLYVAILISRLVGLQIIHNQQQK